MSKMSILLLFSYEKCYINDTYVTVLHQLPVTCREWQFGPIALRSNSIYDRRLVCRETTKDWLFWPKVIPDQMWIREEHLFLKKNNYYFHCKIIWKMKRFKLTITILGWQQSSVRSLRNSPSRILQIVARSIQCSVWTFSAETRRNSTC